MSVASFGSGRQQWSHPLPQVVRDKIDTHSGYPATKIVERRSAARLERLTLARSGFGFTWPAAFPLARIDRVLTRDLSATTWTLPATASDHLPLAGRIRA
ncbi:hypothetical protein ACFVYP_40875 [Kitasatospora sp. NPDC058201]|uniref:hypothetical protein n=1 Tax=unclassified Kitasatospora TaxID=2633591 RepID=UPI00364BCBA6